MSVLVVWRNIVDGKTTSVYMAADSRFTFNGRHFDYGKKVFACKNDASLFGYCGNITYATYIIQSVVDLIEAGVLYKKDDTCDDRAKIVAAKLSELWDNMQGIVKPDKTTIIYCTAVSNTKLSQIYKIVLMSNGQYTCEPIDLEGVKSAYSTEYIQYCVIGSGQDAYNARYLSYKGVPRLEENKFGYITSEIIFRTLVDIIKDATSKDDYGGYPQLAYIYNNKRSRTKLCGTYFNNEFYLGGTRVDIANDNDFARTLKWFDEDFKLRDPITKERKYMQQKQT